MRGKDRRQTLHLREAICPKCRGALQQASGLSAGGCESDFGEYLFHSAVHLGPWQRDFKPGTKKNLPGLKLGRNEKAP